MYLTDGVARRGGETDRQPAGLQRPAHGVFRELGRVVLAAQVREQDIARAGADAFDGKLCRCLVGQVPVFAEDAPLERIGVGAGREHFNVMVGFQQQRIRAEGKVKRANAEQELGRIEGELRSKLLEINA